MIYFRADANEKIGTGHIMRCLSVAEAFKELKKDVCFLVSDTSGAKLVTEKGFPVMELQSKWNDLDGEISQLKDILQKGNADLLIVDSYYVTENYLEQLHEITKIAYIDDLNSFVYPVDWVINYNIYAPDISYKEAYEKAGKYDTNFLLGAKYAPLRKEFQNRNHGIKDKIEKILVTSGGTDERDTLGNVLDVFSKKEWFSEYEYYVVLGKFNVHKDALTAKWQNIKNVHLLYHISDMAEYMMLCDFAITAAGSTTYEMCACGIPAVSYIMADNQKSVASKFHELGLVPYLGDVRSDMEGVTEKICETMEQLRVDKEKRQIQSNDMKNTVDGKGAMALAKELV